MPLAEQVTRNTILLEVKSGRHLPSSSPKGPSDSTRSKRKELRKINERKRRIIPNFF